MSSLIWLRIKLVDCEVAVLSLMIAVANNNGEIIPLPSFWKNEVDYAKIYVACNGLWIKYRLTLVLVGQTLYRL